MTIRLSILTLMVCAVVSVMPVAAQMDECRDTVMKIAPNLSTNERAVAIQTNAYRAMGWYGSCIVIGADPGLFRVDPQQPEMPATQMGFGVSTVATIATRPVDLTVAVAVEDETTVYVLGIMSMLLLETEGTRVTLLAYSQDGSLLAVASSDFEDEYGLLFDPRVEVWNIRGDMISTIYSEGDAINAVGFNSDNNRILVSDFVQGYVGNDVSYWELDGTSPLWRYWDMIDNLPTPSINDPLLVMTVAMHGDIAAFGGVDGYYNDRNFYGLAVHLWDVETQQRQLEIVVSRQREDEDIYTVSGPALAFSADGMILATAQSGGIIELWDTVDGSKMNEIDTELDDIFQLAFSWDDALLAALTEDDLIVIDVAEMRVIASYEAVTSEG